MREVFKSYLETNPTYKDRMWKLVSLRVSTPPQMPEGELSYRIQANVSSNPAHVKLDIYLLVDGKEEGRIRATGRVDVKVTAAISTRLLEKGHTIGPGDIKLAPISLSRVDDGALTDPKEALGLSCRTRIRPGQPVLTKDLVREDVVSRGDMVTILAVSGNIKVSTRGQAKRSGFVGEAIPVMNLNSKKMIVAEIVNANTVQVTF